MSFRKLGMIFFIFGVLISLFSGVFDFIGGLEEARLPVLVILGAFVGLINISEKEKMNFLISSAVFIVASDVIVDFSTSNFFLFDGLFQILFNLAVFVSAAAITVSLKMVFEYLSEYDQESDSDLPSPGEREHMENVWDIIVFVAVAMVIVILVLESFFDLRPYPDLADMLQFADYLIIIIFTIDLVVIYRKSEDLKNFLKTSWLDIIAVIPLGSAFRLTKLSRGSRIIKIFTKTHKAVTRVNRSAKYFSTQSGFNKLMNKKNKVGNSAKKSGKKKAKSASSAKAKQKPSTKRPRKKK
ncbi:MAG: ion transporter [Candidatus Woesearchaeota archaeon]